jgi:hypothetical protein
LAGQENFLTIFDEIAANGVPYAQQRRFAKILSLLLSNYSDPEFTIKVLNAMQKNEDLKAEVNRAYDEEERRGY